jgi:hypothetical protein
VVFFAVRATIFPGLGTPRAPVQAVEPTEGLAQ